MEIAFGRRAPFSVGIEEEFQLLHGESYELTSRFEELLEAAGGDERIKPELMQSVVEVATPVAATVSEALEHARELRARLRDAAAERGLTIASAGTHPFSRYEHQEITDAPRYRELIEAMRWVAERELIFGLHVHVGLDDAEEAIAVCRALRTYLPELLALSANSPFWHGRDTGLASTRIKVFDSFPRSGLPPAFESWDEFERVVERGVRTRSFPDYTFLWWDLRPHPKLGTVEVRICDAVTRLETLDGIVALVVSLVASLSARYRTGERLTPQPYTLVDENKWRAARYGLGGDLIDLERDEERAAREAVAALVEHAAPAARRLGCAVQLEEIPRLCERGTGADEQRAVHAAGGSLLAVAQWLAEQTVAGV